MIHVGPFQLRILPGSKAAGNLAGVTEVSEDSCLLLLDKVGLGPLFSFFSYNTQSNFGSSKPVFSRAAQSSREPQQTKGVHVSCAKT